jgi:hypothetical protein
MSQRSQIQMLTPNIVDFDLCIDNTVKWSVKYAGKSYGSDEQSVFYQLLKRSSNLMLNFLMGLRVCYI